MTDTKPFNLQRFVQGWSIFLTGLLPLAWLHGFVDRTAHRLIPPLLFVLLVLFGVCLWESCKNFNRWPRAVFLAGQLVVAGLIIILFIVYLINQPIRE